MKVKFTNSFYLLSVVAMVLISVAAVVLISIFSPGPDNTAIIVAIFGFTTATFSILTWLKSQETHLSVNSRMDEYKKNIEELSLAIGVKEGIKEGIRQANERTDEIEKNKKKG